MAAPIESVNADTLLALLHEHSDIDPASFAALSCTSKTYSEAVERLWPHLMTRYSNKCDIGSMTIEPPARFNERDFDEDELEWCCEYTCPPAPSGKRYVRFDFSEMDNWSRSNALMSVHVARQSYFLTTKDFAIIPAVKNSRGGKFYRFDDVIQAAVLRHGRGALFTKMCAKLEKRRRFWAIRDKRRDAARALGNAAPPEVLLSQHYVDKYCQDFYKTGRGGMRHVKTLFYSHSYFSYQVIFDAVRGPFAPLNEIVEHESSYLTAAEQQRVSHLQIAYVLTMDKEYLKEAVRIVCSMLLWIPV